MTDHSSGRVRQCPLPFETGTGKGAEGLRMVVGLDGESQGRGAQGTRSGTCLGLGRRGRRAARQTIQ